MGLLGGSWVIKGCPLERRRILFLNFYVFFESQSYRKRGRNSEQGWELSHPLVNFQNDCKDHDWLIVPQKVILKGILKIKKVMSIYQAKESLAVITARKESSEAQCFIQLLLRWTSWTAAQSRKTKAKASSLSEFNKHVFQLGLSKRTKESCISCTGTHIQTEITTELKMKLLINQGYLFLGLNLTWQGKYLPWTHTFKHSQNAYLGDSCFLLTSQSD